MTKEEVREFIGSYIESNQYEIIDCWVEGSEEERYFEEEKFRKELANVVRELGAEYFDEE